MAERSRPLLSDPYMQAVAIARRILGSHIRMLDGRCRGCVEERGHLVRHPCGPVTWAAKMDGHDMTVRFLTGER